MPYARAQLLRGAGPFVVLEALAITQLYG
jgi:hypothetical protein